jgi:HD-GYP domain-containing protein (c-di-GMP phosphodiesterase class II)
LSTPTPKRRGRILVSLLLLLFLVGVVPLLWTSYTLVGRSRQMLEEDQLLILNDKARSLSQQVAWYTRGVRDRVRTISQTLELDADAAGVPFAKRRARISETKALERYMTEDSPLSYVGVVDTAGVGAYAGQRFYETTINMQLEEGFKRGLEAKSVTNYPVMSTSVKEPVVVLAEPIRPHGDDGPVEGVVVAVASLGPLWKMASDMAEGGILEVYVVDGRGRLVAHSDPNRLEGDLEMSGVEIVRLFLKSARGATATQSFEIPTVGAPRQMLGTYTRVPGDSGFGVIVQVDTTKAYHSVGEMRRQAVTLVVVVMVVAVFFGILFAGEISRPIRELARGARQLAAGNYGTRVTVGSRNEVGVLADAFNVMGDEIQKSITEIQKHAETNKELFMGSIKMLANAIDEKDPYTRGHSERVAYYSMVVAKNMGMNDEEVEKVYLSGVIHDVGKIGIEDKILRKPAALTDEEYEMMKQHPTKGAHILDAVPILKAMAGAGLQHHENLDGSGYPDGLKGEEIPLLGRIVSVADAYDAMTTDRPYSKAMTQEAALARLRFLAGKKFDPDCVTAMEQAGAAGDLSTAKARRASVESRKPQTPSEPPVLPAAADAS